MEKIAVCECGCGGVTTRVRQREGAYLAGQYRRFVRGHYRRLWPAKAYAEAAAIAGRRISVHRLRAESALGHQLPEGAVVHHADGSKDKTAPLVICPDEAYHQMLHGRMRIVRAGGNPNTDRLCTRCHQPKAREWFDRDRRNRSGRYGVCKACRRSSSR